MDKEDSSKGVDASKAVSPLQKKSRSDKLWRSFGDWTNEEDVWLETPTPLSLEALCHGQ